MSRELEVQSSEEFIRSLKKRPLFHFGRNEDKFSFVKVLLAIVACLIILLYFFQGENIIAILMGKDSRFESTDMKADYICDENNSSYADSISPMAELEEIKQTGNSLTEEKLLLDKEKEEIENEINKRNEAINSELEGRLEKYNEKTLLFNEKYDEYEKKSNLLNEKIKNYNDYLEKNCVSN